MTFIRQISFANENSSAGATRLTGCAGNVDLRLDSNAADIRAIIYPVPGDFKSLFARIIANAATASSTIDLLINGSDGNQTVTIGAGATGEFEDLSNEDTIVEDDAVAYEVNNGTGGDLTFGILAICFEGKLAGKPFPTMKVANGYDLFHSGTETFQHPFGSIANTTNKAGTQIRANFSGIWDHFDMHISSNAKSTDMIYRNQVNGSDGNLVVTVGAGATGFFEDHTNQNVIDESDILGMVARTAASDGTIVPNYFSNHFHPTENNTYPFGITHDSGLSSNNGQDLDYGLGGTLGLSVSNANCPIQMTGIAKNFGLSLTSNSMDGDTIFNLVKNNSDVISITVGAGVTGQINDLSSGVDVVDEDDLHYNLNSTSSTTGSITLRNIRVAISIPEDEEVSNKMGMSIASARYTKGKQTMGIVA